MCGIFGVIATSADSVRRATEAGARGLRHRGPDDEGLELIPFGGATLGLAQTRLSIIDLSPLGHQPMRHAPTGCQLVFNGEIYNYRRLRCELEREGETFRGGSDTEVLLAGLARHGESYLERLEGMYAFGWFNPRENRLMLCRDPAGIKPLYLAETDSSLIFSSEVRAILATGLVPRELDRQGVAGYLAYGAVQHPHTMYRAVRSLQPGGIRSFEPSADTPGWRASSTRTFWRLPSTNLDWTTEGAQTALRESLTAAVDDHLMADVPVGLFLSSGIDSTILAGLAARHRPAIQSFTVGFDDHVQLNERQIAAATARRFGLRHRELTLSADEARACFSKWLAALDEPSIDGLNVFVISQAVRSQEIKVALSGLGADELFGGYPSFRDVPRLARVVGPMRGVPRTVRRGLARVAAVGRSVAVQEKLADMLGGNGTFHSLYFQRRRAMSDSQLNGLGLDARELGLDENFLCEETLWDVDRTAVDPIRAISQLEFRCYEGNMLLRDADANGMAFGLEIRVPFLDRRVVELAHSIPGSVRLPAGAPGKHLLRRAFFDLLSTETLTQRKRGFVLPIGSWMAGALRPQCEAALAALKNAGILQTNGVERVWNTFLASPTSQIWSRALALVVLGDFLERSTRLS
ncbi:MAG: asparagine synthase (glutamine-hydrolyzing) [Planctomycetaceae bacterium]|nr:MAG: asparagine synthase (glutamine-hydrolyzing) [Planctomycetaceae bacterium]